MSRDSKHQKVQKNGKIRDNYICRVCGRNFKPQGHHIINYAYGGAANVNNIVTLCDSCHKRVHSGRMDIGVF